jgi:hypothetical protein
MPLTSASLKAKIKTNLTGKSWVNTEGPALDELCAAIADAVVLEIQTNALVNGLGLVAPPGGGPVTGAAMIT